MRAIIQRAKQASVTVDSQIVGQIEKGLVVLLGVSPEDTYEDCERMASKLVKLKLWPDAVNAQQWRRSVADIGGKTLCISQFTLYAKVTKGAKPDFHGASKGQHAQELYEKTCEYLAQLMPNGSTDVERGVFGALMEVSLINDGPVTIQYDTKSTNTKDASFA